VKRDTYPSQFGIRDIRNRYFETRNQMIRAWNLIYRLRAINNLEIPLETWNELENILSFDTFDRIFMSCVFSKQEAEQEAFKKLRLILCNKVATMEGLARIEVLLEETDQKIKYEVPDWVLERMDK